MKKSNLTWIVGAIATLVIILAPVIYFLPKGDKRSDDPWQNLPLHPVHTAHAAILEDRGPFETGQDVTKACLECHENSASEMMATAHWT